MPRSALDHILAPRPRPFTRRALLRSSALGAAAGLTAHGNRSLAVPATPMSPADGKADKAESGEWPAYGQAAGGGSHSPLTQIDRENVGNLEVAWTFRTGELETYKGTDFPVSAVAFEAVPIMAGGVLYFPTATARTFALDAATGEQLWLFDPQLDRNVNYSNPASRGVATWVDETKAAGEDGYRTIFVGTIDARLFALDAATGEPRPEFGDNGVINLKSAAMPEGGTNYDPEILAGQLNVTSPPVTIGDLVIVGGAIGDNIAVVEQRGLVQAFDARNGEPRWTWDPIPRQPDDPGYETWNGPLAHRTGAANAWPPMSVDAERGLVFVATTSPSPDYYGGERIGQNLLANSVVALDAEKGEPLWHFQTVHHDLWDYDVPMQPVLLELDQDGERVPAVAVGTKQGHIFVLHRETGEPLFPVEERPVPASTVPGEESWPTQPFPAQLPVFGLRSVSEEEAWGLTDEALATAREKITELHFEGVFTPPGLTPTAEAPSNAGGFNWGGLSYDPERGILVGATNRFAAIVQLFPRDDPPSDEHSARGGVRLEEEIGQMLGTPYVLSRTILADLETRLPYTKPPWGTLAAVNLLPERGDLQFEVPLGTMFDPAEQPEAAQWGSLNLAGPMTTASGLVFVAASVDDHLRAFDTETGEELWKSLLPAGGQATPMTYAVNGRQFLVQAAGGHGPLGTKQGDYVVAYALPESA